MPIGTLKIGPRIWHAFGFMKLTTLHYIQKKDNYGVTLVSKHATKIQKWHTNTGDIKDFSELRFQCLNPHPLEQNQNQDLSL